MAHKARIFMGGILVILMIAGPLSGQSWIQRLFKGKLCVDRPGGNTAGCHADPNFRNRALRGKVFAFKNCFFNFFE